MAPRLAGTSIHGEAVYRLEKKKISKPLEAGLWMEDEEFKKNRLVHFTCPHCSQINRTDADPDDGGTVFRKYDIVFFSVWCCACHRHLWLDFEGITL